MRKVRAYATAIVWISVSITGWTDVTAIKVGKLVDPENGTISQDQIILVNGTTIEAVGANLPIPDGAEIVDLSNATVLPGLFDCHTHLCLNLAHPAGETMRDFYGAMLLSNVSNTTGFRAIIGVANAKSYLDAGFTTVRDVGNAANYADTDLRRAIEEGIVPGPTLLNAGRIITPYGGQFPSRTPPFFRQVFGVSEKEFIGVLRPDGMNLGNPEYLYADSRDEMRKAIRENILYGAKLIKIVTDDQPYVYSVEEIRFIVDEAAASGMKVAAHCLTDGGARRAIEGGVASVEHGHLMTDDTLRLAKQKGVTLVGTDFTEAAAAALGMPVEFYNIGVDRAKRAYAIGVTMAFGTDIFADAPGLTRGELAVSYVDVYKTAGYSNQYILQMMTTNAARLLGIENDRGRIRPGLAADIIATRQNPLDDISALKDVQFVMKDGRTYRRPK